VLFSDTVGFISDLPVKVNDEGMSNLPCQHVFLLILSILFVNNDTISLFSLLTFEVGGSVSCNFRRSGGSRPACGMILHLILTPVTKTHKSLI
jgi:hypothetical protein